MLLPLCTYIHALDTDAVKSVSCVCLGISGCRVSLFDTVNVPLGTCNITYDVAYLIKLMCIQASSCNVLF